MNAEYRLSDKTMALLNKRAIRRFEETKEENALLDFDELNVMQSAKRLYKKLDKDNRVAWLELAKNRYRRCKPHGDWIPTLEWLNALLEGYDPVTKYIYENEVVRKRDYLTESVISAGQKWTDGEKETRPSTNKASGKTTAWKKSGDASEKAKEYKRALGYWVRMTAHYCDAVSDATTIKAYTDAGVEEVIWHTEEDDKVCPECEARNGVVYRIDRVPAKPHWGCRCWLTPVRNRD